MKRRVNRRRNMLVEPLEARLVLTTLACTADATELHSIPFEVSGGGPAPNGIPLVPGETEGHFASGDATRLGGYEGAGIFEFGGFTGPTTGTFSGSFIFGDAVIGGSEGDQIAFHYGDVDAGASGPGEFTIIPQQDGNIVVEFLAEFTLDPDESTGRFDKYSEGSFLMLARTSPFAPPGPGDTSTQPFDYTWKGAGHINFPVGDGFEVTNTHDAGAGSLRHAIMQANDNEGIDTITFADGVAGTIPLNSELKIEDDVTICGPGRELRVSGQESTRVFNVDPFDVAFGGEGERIAVEIHDLKIADGLATDAPGIPDPAFAFGGGLYNRGSDVALESVRFHRNQAGTEGTFSGVGGAIANEFGGTVTVNESGFARNTALGVGLAAGGAITADAGPTLEGRGTKSPRTIISDSWFSRNTATALITDPASAGDFAPFAGFAFGGSINALAGELVVQDSTFSHNSVHSGDGINGNSSGNANGGAILVSDFSPFIPVTEENPIPGRDSINRVEGSRFRRNLADAGDGDGASEGGYANGGAVAANIAFPFFPETLVISDSVFAGNRAQGGTGGSDGGDGGLATGGAIAGLSGANVVVGNSKLALNTAQGGRGSHGGSGGMGLGGAIGMAPARTSVPTDFELFVPTLDLSHTLVTLNRAQGGSGSDRGSGGNGNGGGLGFLGGSGGSMDHAYIAGNRATGGSSWRGRGGNGQGGGVYNDAGTVRLTSSKTFLNSARAGRGRGFGDGLGGGIFNSAAGTFEIDNSSLDGVFWNRADDRDSNNIFGELTLI